MNVEEKKNVKICPLSMRPCFEDHRLEWFAGIYDALGIDTSEDDGPVLECAFTDDFGTCPFQAFRESMKFLRECITSTHDHEAHDCWLRVSADD